MQRKKYQVPIFSFSARDFAVSMGILACAVELCVFLSIADSSDGFAYPIFVLAVLLISRYTTGYVFGILAALFSVVGINYIFTYPYWSVNFTLSGYPLTFFTMLCVSLITCTMTSRIKQQESIRMEIEKEKMRANLLRSVSHDIRTPLTSIVGATSAILENPTLPADDQHKLLEDVRDEAQWLIRVVENLLSVTRIGDSRAHITKQNEIPEEIMAEVVQKFRKRFPDVKIQVKTPDEVLLVPMDPILIEQVLSNLLENAVIHGETTSQIVMSVEKDGIYARFSIQDNGCGIPTKVLPHLFDGTIKHTETPTGDGKRNMGLGLSVCMAIIRAHSGTMQAQNLPTGAEFSFRLPLSEEE